MMAEIYWLIYIDWLSCDALQISYSYFTGARYLWQ